MYEDSKASGEASKSSKNSCSEDSPTPTDSSCDINNAAASSADDGVNNEAGVDNSGGSSSAKSTCGNTELEFKDLYEMICENLSLSKTSSGLANRLPAFRKRRDTFTELKACTFSMGSMIGADTFVEECKTTGDPSFRIDYIRRRFTIFFDHLGAGYKVCFRFKDLGTGIVVEKEEFATNLTIHLRYPGEFYRCFPGDLESKRVTLIPLAPDSDVRFRPSRPFLPLPHEEALDIGDWTVYRLRFDTTRPYRSKFAQAMKLAASYNLVPQDIRNCCPTIKVVAASDLPKPYDYADRSSIWNFDFDVLYMLESCISFRIFNKYTMTKEFYDIVASFDPHNAVGVLNAIFHAQKPVYNPCERWWTIWNKKKDVIINSKTSVPQHCTMMRKIIISPTHIYYQPLMLEVANRVTRHFKKHIHSFVRVQFINERFDKIHGGPAISARIYEVLSYGLQVGSKKFEFLAYSSSQLRLQGCWFFASNHEVTAQGIRNWLGTFSNDKIVAKHAARIGQCFSTTRSACTLTKQEIGYTDDVVRGKYTFSDGVGLISPKLAEEVAHVLEKSSVPSAFQFRLGGAKGVLTVCKDLENHSVKIVLRPSQIKFESNHTTLEIIRTSMYNHSFLNRQSITLLSTLGVKDKVFMDLMQEMVRDVNKAFQNTEEAIRVLLANLGRNGPALSLVSMLQAGFLDVCDGFTRNMLNLFRIKVLKDLKKKAKIVVQKGAYLLGVMDETGTLKEGQVFVQICDTAINGKGKQIITGDVIVYRNPCIHPGDIRTLTAVDAEPLRYLTNVIVFPQKGSRDIPSMCSGGDLDGDDYTVCWDPRLLPPNNEKPMDYTQNPPEKVEQVQIQDIIEFFVYYINKDMLGQIANAHLAIADYRTAGAKDTRCLTLAQLHSIAVDFSKTGTPAKLEFALRASTFPDFMEKKDKPEYISDKALGRIFRGIDKADYKDYQSTLTQDTVFDTRMIVPDMELYIGEARDLKSQYQWQLFAHMSHYGIQTEAEIFSGFVIKWLKSSNNRSKNQQHHAKRVVEEFKADWKNKFEQEFLDANGKIDLSKKPYIDAKAAAWYYVAYHPNERVQLTSEDRAAYFSFPWCAYQYICDVVKGKNSEGNVDYPSFTEEIIMKGRKQLDSIRNDTAH